LLRGKDREFILFADPFVELLDPGNWIDQSVIVIDGQTKDL
jgi:hypothetical protein